MRHRPVRTNLHNGATELVLPLICICLRKANRNVHKGTIAIKMSWLSKEKWGKSTNMRVLPNALSETFLLTFWLCLLNHFSFSLHFTLSLCTDCVMLRLRLQAFNTRTCLDKLMVHKHATKSRCVEIFFLTHRGLGKLKTRFLFFMLSSSSSRPISSKTLADLWGRKFASS